MAMTNESAKWLRDHAEYTVKRIGHDNVAAMKLRAAAVTIDRMRAALKAVEEWMREHDDAAYEHDDVPTWLRKLVKEALR